MDGSRAGTMTEAVTEVVLVVDVANVMGSRPDGWWRDRVGAASRLLEEIAPVIGALVVAPDGCGWRIRELVAVLEGQARRVELPREVPGMRLLRASRDGDTAIVEATRGLLANRDPVVVVTADRGLRARIPSPGQAVGPRWLWGVTTGSSPCCDGGTGVTTPPETRAGPG
jgi:hypothetical protein